MPITNLRAIRRARITGALEGGSHITFRRLCVSIEGGMFVQRGSHAQEITSSLFMRARASIAEKGNASADL
jgi:hypothetical protein